jgi:hypothetical protein
MPAGRDSDQEREQGYEHDVPLPAALRRPPLRRGSPLGGFTLRGFLPGTFRHRFLPDGKNQNSRVRADDKARWLTESAGIRIAGIGLATAGSNLP